MWHLVCGDAGAVAVRLWLGACSDDLRVLCDDLAVGPLTNVDSPPCAERHAFWRQVWPVGREPMPNFAGLAVDAAWLADLAKGSRPVCVWHGDSCSEQLLLARVAAVLQGVAVEFWEVPCGTGDGRVASRRALGMITPAELPAYTPPRQVSAERCAQLAEQWRVVQGGNSQVRRWPDGVFVEESFAPIDAALLAACTLDWRPLARAMADVMVHCDGFFATDLFLEWRTHVLAESGQLQLSGTAAEPCTARQVRRAR